MNMLKIGITSRVVQTNNYVDNRDALSQDWTRFIEKINGVPIQIPNLLSKPELFLEELKIDALILSGGDNVGTPPERDKTEHTLIDFAVKNDIPILGVCRGMQKLNQYFGGTQNTLSTKDHVNNDHTISIKQESFLNIFGSEAVQVNSFHHNVITEDHLGHNLVPFAFSKNDNTVEGFFHSEFPFIGVMWHPEREQKKFDVLIMDQLLHRKIKR